MVIFLKILEERQIATEKPKMRGLPEGTKTILRHLAVFFSGMLMGSVHEFAALSPFGVAFTAAVRTSYILTAGMGAAAGYILTQDSVTSLRYIAALVSAGVLSRLVCEFEKIKKFKLLPSCISFLACFLSGMAVLLAQGIKLQSFSLYLAEGLIAFATAYFISSSAELICAGRPRHGINIRELGALCGAALLFLFSVNDVAIFQVSFARIAAGLLVLLAAYLYKEAGGAVAGIFTAVIFSASGDVGAPGIGFSVGGLIAGIFSYARRWTAAAAYICAFLTAFVFAGGGPDKLYLFLEAVIAAVLFAALPARAVQALENLLLPKQAAPDCNAQRDAVCGRLLAAANAVDDVEKSVAAVAATLEKNERGGRDAVFVHVQDAVCAGCGRFDYCWNVNFSDTLRAFGEMRDMLKNSVAVNASNAPVPFSSRCIRLTSLTENFNKNYTLFTATAAAEKRIAAIRSVTAEQFGGLSDMLKDLTGEFAQETRFDSALAEKLRDVFENEFGLCAQTVSCCRNKDGRIMAEMTLAQPPRELNIAALRDSFGEVCGREFDLPVIRGEKTVCFCERPELTVESASTQISADSERMCGDNFESFYDGRGNYIVILSDGMGTGPRAAVDSAMAAGLMSRLVRAGFGFSSALRLVNSSLLLKSRDESLATLDILKIDLFTGASVFYKAGAAASVIKRKGKLLEIKKAALPAGILRDVTFASCDGAVQPGDIIVMASDGAFDYSKNSVRDELSKIKEEDAQTIAKRIALRAKSAKGENRCDDITVIALRLKSRRRN